MTEASRLESRKPDSLERGRFSDGVRSFSVRVSNHEVPDSFQVYVTDAVAEIVLVISGLNSGALKATWGLNWVTASEEWREWCEAEAFMAFYNGTRPTVGSAVRSAVGRVRFCNG